MVLHERRIGNLIFDPIDENISTTSNFLTSSSVPNNIDHVLGNDIWQLLVFSRTVVPVGICYFCDPVGSVYCLVLLSFNLLLTLYIVL